MRNHGQRKRKIESGDNFSFLFLPIFKTNEQTNTLRIKLTLLFPTLIVGFQNHLLSSDIYQAYVQPRSNDWHFGEYKEGCM